MIINTTTLEYPLGLDDVQKAHPNTSLALPLRDAELRPLGFAMVEPVPAPLAPTGQTAVAAAVQIDGHWRQSWSLRPATEEELLRRCDYRGFWNALLVSPVYQAIRAQACTDLGVNMACTEFIAAMADAKIGSANRDALQACIWLVLQAATLEPEQVAELEQLLDDSGLGLVYSLTPA